MILKLKRGVTPQEIKNNNFWLYSYTNNFDQEHFLNVISKVVIQLDQNYVSFPLLFSLHKNGYVTINVSEFEAQLHGYDQVQSKLSIPCGNCTHFRSFLFKNYLNALVTTKHYKSTINSVSQSYEKTFKALFIEMIKIKNQLRKLSEHPHDQKTKNSLKNSLKFTKAKLSRVRFDRDCIRRFVAKQSNLAAIAA